MTKEEIIEMAKVAQLPYDYESGDPMWLDELEIFARLAAEKERESCVKMVNYVYDNIVTDEHIRDMAFKISARGQE